MQIGVSVLVQGDIKKFKLWRDAIVLPDKHCFQSIVRRG